MPLQVRVDMGSLVHRMSLSTVDWALSVIATGREIEEGESIVVVKQAHEVMNDSRSWHFLYGEVLLSLQCPPPY